MATLRRTVTDFIAQVAARTQGAVSGATYVASPNTDGTLNITKNGTSLFARVIWNGSGKTAITDSNPSGDTVTVEAVDGTTGIADAQVFLNNLN
ncbi:MAG: hypothetical protein LAN36_11455 [Acidobacteriia bacterium]|nr:hypothetical protein [Terriglobia bacterium]